MRSFHDSLVVAVPSEADIERLGGVYPDIRVELHATPGRKLSDEFQDGKSYRYGVLNLGGRDLADVLEQFESCRARLGIELLPIEAAQDPRVDVPRESMIPAHDSAAESVRPPPPEMRRSFTG